MQTIDKPKLVIFHPYMFQPGSTEANEWKNYRGQTGTFSLVWQSSDPDGTPRQPVLRMHDELTPGGHPVGGANGLTGAPGAIGLSA